MKKILLTLFIIFFTLCCYAQTVTYGVKGGLNLAKQTSNATNGIQRENLTGFHICGIANFDIKNFTIRPGVQYSLKGYRLTNQLVDIIGQPVGSSTNKVKFNYLEIPINLLYNIQASKNTKVYLGGGPYLAYALAAKHTDGTQTFDIPLGGDTGLKRFDYGVSLATGLNISKVLFEVSYDLGLANLTTGASPSLKNRCLGISVGYIFN